MSADLVSSIGVLIAAGLACAAILMPRGNHRSLVMLTALAIVPVLVFGDQWNTERIVALRDSPARIAAAVIVAATLIGVGLLAFRRWSNLLPLAIAAVLPFRVPLEAGGEQANLLVPLYLVIAAGVIFTALRDLRSPAAPGPAADPSNWGARWLLRLLAAVVGLYAIQSLYAADTSAALQDICFFFVPFSLVFVLIRECDWNLRLLLAVVGIVVVEAVLFVLFGFWEYATRTLIWNPEVIRANDFHPYFRVNSLFWDPNMFGRYLALALVALATILLWVKTTRAIAITTGLIVLIWLGLVTTFSLSSLAALLGGLAVLAALRWSLRWTAVAVAVCLAAIGVALLVDGGLFEEERQLNNRTSGRGDLVTGGLELFAKKPLWGHGSASFSVTYLEQIADGQAPVSESHTEPITVAVEQGLAGLALYFALIAAALSAMCAGLRGAVPGFGGGPHTSRAVVARAGLIAVFAALLVHTLSYAGFLEDPVTWVLIALACALPSVANRSSRLGTGDTPV